MKALPALLVALVAAVTLVSVAAGDDAASRAAKASTAVELVVPYVSHGAGVYVDAKTGRPIATPASAPPPPNEPGVHTYRGNRP